MNKYEHFKTSTNGIWALEDTSKNVKVIKKYNSKNVSTSNTSPLLNNNRNIRTSQQVSVLSKTDSKTSGNKNTSLVSKHQTEVRRKILETYKDALPGRVVQKNPSDLNFILKLLRSEYEFKTHTFKKLIHDESLNMKKFKNISFTGISSQYRAVSWKLLCGYIPVKLERREEILKMKRLNYNNLVIQIYDRINKENKHILKQIRMDIPRTNPLLPLFQIEEVQRVFERILYIWAARHPASGYVQGMNDFVTPFFIVFFQETMNDNNIDANALASLSNEQRDAIEADCYWCLSKILDDLQDNYIYAQVGIQQKLKLMEKLVQRIDSRINSHLNKHIVTYLHFAFRWLNNLLTREFPLNCIIRLWDTYMAEIGNLPSFQVYICVAFLIHWREDLLRLNDFQSILLFLQNLPTQSWTCAQVDVIIAKAYCLQYRFENCINHF